MMGNFGVFKGVYAYYQNKAQYPCSASSAVTAAQDCATMSGYVGYIPYLDVDVKYTSLGAWLINNEWFGLTSYVYTTPTRVSLTVMGGTLTSSCAANAAVVTCN